MQDIYICDNINVVTYGVGNLRRKGTKEKKQTGTNRAGDLRNNTYKKTRIIIIITTVLLFVVIAFTVFAVVNRFNSGIYPNVYFRDINLSGKSVREIDKILHDYSNKVYNKTIVVKQNDKMLLEVNSEDIGLSINQVQTQKEILDFARSGNIILDNFNILKALILGKTIDIKYDIDTQKASATVDKILSLMDGRVKDDNYTIADNMLIITKGVIGVDVNKEELLQDLADGLLQDNKVFEYVLKTFIRESTELDVDVLYSNVAKKAVDARIDETQKPAIFIAHENGIDLDKQELREVLQLDENKVEGKEIQFKLEIIPPEVKLADLKYDRYEDLLGTYSTLFSTSAANENRNTNIQVAAKYINGTIVMPGTVFSFNNTVGDCGSAARGFKMATVFSGGKVEQGMGGGVCQVSSTLYNAVIYANLEIVARDNHGYTVSYVDCGRDATIYYPYLDFKFKNNRAYPIKVVTSYDPAGKLTTSIYGTKEENEYDVSIESYVLTRIPRSTTYVKDNTLLVGTEKTDIIGQDGFTSIAYKVMKQDGKIVKKVVLSNDTYSPMNNVVLVGTKNPIVDPYSE